MGPARRACDWEQGERVPPRWDLVAALRVRLGNTQQATKRQLAAFGLTAETDDGRLATVYRIGGTNPPASALRTRGVRLGIQTAANCRRGGMADAIDLGSIARQGVEVRLLSSALLNGECGTNNS